MTPELKKALEEAESLQAQLEAKRKEARGLAIAEAQKLITVLGISADELKFDGEKPAVRRTRTTGATIPPKYKSLDGERTWTGRGRTPKWVTEYLDADPKHAVEDLLI